MVSNIFVAGGTGMVGSAIIRRLQAEGFCKILASYHRTRPEQTSVDWQRLDLTNQANVRDFFLAHRPEIVFLAAAKVGGIQANTCFPAEFIYQNLMIEANIIQAAHLADVNQLLFLGSSCIYPKFAGQPMSEEALLTGTLEPTNEPYALAKISGIKLCESYNRQYGRDYRSLMPTNLYGPHDNFDLKTSHVLPALIRKLHLGRCLGADDWTALRRDLTVRPIEGADGRSSAEAILLALNKQGIIRSKNSSGSSSTAPAVSISLWGTGRPRREFLHVDDLADACLACQRLPRETLAKYTQPRLSHLNVGTGWDLSIAELAALIAKVVGFDGQIVYDPDQPDGTPRKLLDVSKMKALGWQAKIPLEQGLEQTYAWYVENDHRTSNAE